MLRAPRGPQGPKAPLVSLGSPASLGATPWAPPAPQDPLARLAPRGHRAPLAIKDLQVPLKFAYLWLNDLEKPFKGRRCTLVFNLFVFLNTN